MRCDRRGPSRERRASRPRRQERLEAGPRRVGRGPFERFVDREATNWGLPVPLGDSGHVLSTVGRRAASATGRRRRTGGVRDGRAIPADSWGRIDDGPPLRQVCRLRRRPASRRRVDAPPVDGLDVRRSVRDDDTICRFRAPRTCHRSRTRMDKCRAVAAALGVQFRNADARVTGRTAHGPAMRLPVRSPPQTQCEASP